MALKSLFGSIKRPADKAVQAGISKDRSLKSQGIAPKKKASKMVSLKRPSGFKGVKNVRA